MSILNSTQIAAMRTTLNTTLPDTCNILTGTSSLDGNGNSVLTWGTATAGVACRIDPGDGSREESGAAIQDFNSYVLTLPTGTTVAPGQRVEIGSYTYDIIAVDLGKSWAISIRAELERVT